MVGLLNFTALRQRNIKTWRYWRTICYLLMQPGSEFQELHRPLLAAHNDEGRSSCEEKAAHIRVTKSVKFTGQNAHLYSTRRWTLREESDSASATSELRYANFQINQKVASSMDRTQIEIGVRQNSVKFRSHVTYFPFCFPNNYLKGSPAHAVEFV